MKMHPGIRAWSLFPRLLVLLLVLLLGYFWELIPNLFIVIENLLKPKGNPEIDAGEKSTLLVFLAIFRIYLRIQLDN